MATVSPAPEQTADLLQKLSLDSQTKTADGADAAKKPPATQFGSVVKTEGVNMPAPPNDRSTTPVLQEYFDTNFCYLPNYSTSAYYYGGYESHVNDWEEYSRYVSPDGVEMSPHGVYGDVFHHGYGYAPYGAYAPGSPVPTIGHDGQLYGHQHYQYLGQYYQAPSTPVASQPPVKPPTSQADVSTSVPADQPTVPVDTKTNTNGVTKTNASNGTLPAKTAPKNSLTSNGTVHGRGGLSGGVHPGYQDPRFGYSEGIRSPIPWLDGPVYTDAHHGPPTTSNIPTTTSHAGNLSSNRNQNLRPLPHLMGLHPASSGMGPGGGYANRMYSNNRMYGQCGTAFRTGQGFSPNSFDSRSNGRGWLAVDNKYKVRGRGNGYYGFGNENMEGLNELNRGPRSGRFKNNPKTLGPNVVIAVKGQSLPSFSTSDTSSLVPDRTEYNREDFPDNYPDAKFFVIKSYSEDDVHKSVKYNVWASTPNGNKKLDDAFREAEEKSGPCPIFLFFSVNASGQFVGIAEMAGPVDFNKTVEYWQQDKWNGCFSVKWHIVKDVPNSILKHIILENNENKPVTNSRDTQEIKFEQGIQMLKLFKEHISKTSILDDFDFYETRQKAMQEKRTRQQFQKQVWDGKIAPSTEEKDKNAVNTNFQKPPETVALLSKEAAGQARHGEPKHLHENGTVSGDAPKVVKLTSEKRILVKPLANGVPNGGVNGVANGIADIATRG